MLMSEQARKVSWSPHPMHPLPSGSVPHELPGIQRDSRKNAFMTYLLDLPLPSSLLVHSRSLTSSVVPLDHTLTTGNALWKLYLVVVHCGTVWSKETPFLAYNLERVLVQAFLGCGYERIVMGTQFELSKYAKCLKFLPFRRSQLRKCTYLKRSLMVGRQIHSDIDNLQDANC